MAIPLYLAVHVLGVATALGLSLHAMTVRRREGRTWRALALGALLVAASHLATGGGLVGELAWPVYARAVGYALLAVGAAGRLLGPATALSGPTAVLVPVARTGAHAAAGLVGLMAAFAAARGRIGRGRDVAPLAVGLGLWAAADAVLPGSQTVAGLLSLFGSLGVGWWLVRRARASLFARFTLAFVSVLLVVAIGLASASGLVLRGAQREVELDRLDDRAAEGVREIVSEQPEDLLASAQAFAPSQLDELRSSDSLDTRARALTSVVGVDIALFVDDEGRVRGSWDRTGQIAQPLSSGDETRIAGDPLLDRAATQADGAAGVLALGTTDLLSLAAVPVAPRADGGDPQLDASAGVLVLARRMANRAFTDDLARLSGTDVTLVLGDEVVVSTLFGAQLADVSESLDGRSGENGAVIDVTGADTLIATEQITTLEGLTVGRLVLTQEAPPDTEESFTRALFWTALLGMAVAALLAAAASGGTTRPIRRLTRAAEAVAAGDLSFRVETDRDDEVGRLAEAFDGMTTALATREEDLRRAASTEATLRSRLEAITSSMGEALVAVDRGSRVTTLNPAAVHLVGRPADELVGQRIHDVLQGPSDAGTDLLDELGDADAGGPAASRGAVRAGHRLTPVAATAAPLEDDTGRSLGRIYVLRDVTGEVEVERMKTEFLSNISHELRTPLTPIKGYAEVLKAKDVGRDRTVEFATNISASARRLERIVGMLVDYAALEAGRVEVKLEPTDISEVVDDVLDHWADQAPDRTIRRRISRGLPDVNVDPALLARVLQELVDNAVKFSEGPVTILAEPADDQHVRVTVRDKGRGMDDEEVAGIMRDFHQADGSATRHFGGLGLGLSIVQRILDRFGADLEVDSTPEEGTDMHVVVSVVDGSDS